MILTKHGEGAIKDFIARMHIFFSIVNQEIKVVKEIFWYKIVLPAIPRINRRSFNDCMSYALILILNQSSFSAFRSSRGDLQRSP